MRPSSDVKLFDPSKIDWNIKWSDKEGRFNRQARPVDPADHVVRGIKRKRGDVGEAAARERSPKRARKGSRKVRYALLSTPFCPLICSTRLADVVLRWYEYPNRC